MRERNGGNKELERSSNRKKERKDLERTSE